MGRAWLLGASLAFACLDAPPREVGPPGRGGDGGGLDDAASGIDAGDRTICDDIVLSDLGIFLCDGLEDPAMDDIWWSVGGEEKFDSELTYRGEGAGYAFASAGAQSFLGHDMTETIALGQVISVRAHVYFTAGRRVAGPLIELFGSDEVGPKIAVDDDGRVGVRAGDGPTAYSTRTLPEERWICLILSAVSDDVDGSYTLAVDGDVALSATSLATSFMPLDKLEIGVLLPPETGEARDMEVYFDEVMLARLPLSCLSP